jgi:AhpD family alkylhydroperoxidase
MPISKLSRHGLSSLAHAITHPGALRSRAIGTLLREQVILHVSAINECAVCSVLHGAGARACGLDTEAIAAARKGSEDLDDRTRVALRYAELRTLGQLGDHPDDVRAFEAAYDDRERAEIAALADLFTFNNQFNNTWEAVLPGAASRRRKLGLAED